MAKYLAKRIFYLILTLFIVITVTFFLMKLLPGTPLTNQAKLSKSQIALIYQQYGLDKPVWQQYLLYIAGAVKGNFGTSFQFSDQPVSYLISSRIAPSLQIGLQAIILGVLVGVIIGAFGAMRQNSWVDTTSTIVSILGISIPSFVLAVLLQYYLGLKLGWFPIAEWGGFSYTVLPTLALAATPLAESARFVRTEMVDVLSSDYIELAKAKGLSRTGVIYHHALRNSLIPLITIVGPLAVNIMTGSMVVENIFSIPGIGEQFVKSVLTNDYPTIMGLTIVYSFMLCVVLLFTDILYGVVDPRIRLTGKAN
ncbi:oligopeptide ABC transporter permease [Levilactobacillus brevis]|jgi:oligopeptide transport system permease protein|uniref:ABC-type dipeptide/oligopeptide/nickel transport system, permease component n=4 Tax=Levilactobacillus TaxID=2767886 RepID=Q03PN8_LEVBA|nr:oligopeptide ABC transporter permease [Levilactobacillus brevis]MBL3536407.1 ABC transporter permease [Lactobacillus sp. GPR40-2]MBL3629452.1 ABC transporter permease [Lactobacillus sp. GPB7-4]ABJ64834.1 ABC-type dipeptide/oligopeptide/nickel transport system, permease component [Levilactobacillus brevis ATCC 367]ARW22745.1 Dipeptide transport system permease protein DppB [Levilactobacillus brevis]ARW51370.1 Dipeptide transport system permease protein DppB [Levilactobacillus brevis]